MTSKNLCFLSPLLGVKPVTTSIQQGCPGMHPWQLASGHGFVSLSSPQMLWPLEPPFRSSFPSAHNPKTKGSIPVPALVPKDPASALWLVFLVTGIGGSMYWLSPLRLHLANILLSRTVGRKGRHWALGCCPVHFLKPLSYFLSDFLCLNKLDCLAHNMIGNDRNLHFPTLPVIINSTY